MLRIFAELLGRWPVLGLIAHYVTIPIGRVRRGRAHVIAWPVCAIGLAYLGWLIQKRVSDQKGQPGLVLVLVSVFVSTAIFAAFRARGRTVIQPFRAQSVDESLPATQLVQIGSFAAELLASELLTIRALYDSVSEQRVGAASASPGEQYDALHVTAAVDDVAKYLHDVVPSDTRLNLGPLEVPLGAALAILARMFRGPRLVGSIVIGSTEATVTASFSAPRLTRVWTLSDAYLPGELQSVVGRLMRSLAACMTADLTFRGVAHWRSVISFNEGLSAYMRAVVSGRAHPHLRQAQRALSGALSHDHNFGWVYYNLGLVLEQRIQLDATGHEARQFGPTDSDPAARAYEMAVEANGRNWQPVYALATRWHKSHKLGVRVLCRRVIRLSRHPRARALAYSLMAESLMGGRDGVHLSELLDSAPEGNGAPPRSDVGKARTYGRLAAGYAWIALTGQNCAGHPPSQNRRERALRLVSDCVAMAAGTSPWDVDETGYGHFRHPINALRLHRLSTGYRVAAVVAPNDGDVQLERAHRLERAKRYRSAYRAIGLALDAQPRRARCWAWYASLSTRIAGTDHERVTNACMAALSSAYYARERLESAERVVHPGIFQLCIEALDRIGETTTADGIRAVLDFVDTRTRLLQHPDGVDWPATTAEWKTKYSRLQQRLSEASEQAAETSPGPDEWLLGEYAVAIGCALDPIPRGRQQEPNIEEAIEWFRRGIAHLSAGHSQEVRRRLLHPRLARLYRKKRELEAAAQQAAIGRNVDPTSFEAWYQSAKVAMELSEIRVAAEWWEEALRWSATENDRPEVHYSLGRCYDTLARAAVDREDRAALSDRAIEELRTAIDLMDHVDTSRVADSKGEMWHILGLVLNRLGRYDDASEALEAAAAHGDAFQKLVADYYLGRALVRARRFVEAEQAFSRVCTLAEAQPELDRLCSYKGKVHSVRELLCNGHLGLAWSMTERLAPYAVIGEHLAKARDVLATTRSDGAAASATGWVPRVEVRWAEIDAWSSVRINGGRDGVIDELRSVIRERFDAEAYARLTEALLLRAEGGDLASRRAASRYLHLAREGDDCGALTAYLADLEIRLEALAAPLAAPVPEQAAAPSAIVGEA